MNNGNGDMYFGVPGGSGSIPVVSPGFRTSRLPISKNNTIHGNGYSNFVICCGPS
jgi:hypothetical protein